MTTSLHLNLSQMDSMNDLLQQLEEVLKPVKMSTQDKLLAVRR